VYRVIPKGNKGSTSNDILRMAQYNACVDNADPDGIAVINLSWGGRLDESQIEVDEITDKKFYEALAAKGCLIVKAAGNDNFRRDRRDNLDDALLRVAAIDTSRELSWFSTVGEIAAPGSDTFVVTSQTLVQDPHRVRKPRLCENSPHQRFVNGTSFASPISAGIAAQVVRVLKFNKSFINMENGTRIKLVNRILHASTSLGAINGLRAVAIADQFGQLDGARKQAILNATDSSPLQALLHTANDTLCSAALPNCEKTRDCDAQKACLNLAREKVAMCGNNESQALFNASMAAFKGGDFEIGHQLALASDGALESSKRNRLLREAMNQYFALIGFDLNTPYDRTTKEDVMDRQRAAMRKMSANFLRMAIAPYLATLDRKGSWGTTALGPFLMDGMIFADNIQDALAMGVDAETGEDRGGSRVADTVAEVLARLQILMGERRFFQTLNEIVDQQIDDAKRVMSDGNDSPLNVTDNSSPIARVIDLLIRKQEQGSRGFRELAAIEKRLLEGMRTLNEVYRNTTEKLPMFYEVFPTRSVMKGLVQRQGMSLQEMKDAATVKKAAPVEVMVQLGERRGGPGDFTQAEAAWNVLGQVASGQGWGEDNDPEIIELALERITERWPDFPVVRKASWQLEFEKMVIGSVNADFLAELSDGYWNNQAFGVGFFDSIAVEGLGDRVRKAGRSYRNSPLLTSRAMKMVSYKIVAVLEKSSRRSLVALRGRGDSLHGLGIAWRGLLLDDVVSENVLPVATLSEKGLTRFSTISAPKQTHELGTLNFVDRFMERLLELARRDYSKPAQPDNLSAELKQRDEDSAMSDLLDGAFDIYDPKDPASFGPKVIFGKLQANGAWKKSVIAIKDLNHYPDSNRATNFLSAVNNARIP